MSQTSQTTRESPVQHCRSCGAPVQWVAHSTTGKVAPLDLSPSAEGNLSLMWESAAPDGPAFTGRRLLYHLVPQDERGRPEYAGRLYSSHFMTCPSASAWRKGRAKSQTEEHAQLHDQEA